MLSLPTHPQFVDYTGLRFGKLLVIEFAGDHITPGGQKKRLWKCKCDCGGEITTHASSLKSGYTTSCWCVRRESASRISVEKHGACKGSRETVEFKTWSAMRSRTRNPRNCNYQNYGARGIRVCERWDDFSKFLDDMGPRPAGFSIERIDNNGDYCPENCRWASSVDQNNNTRGNRLIEFGESLTVAQWSRKTGISHTTICQRLKAGWSIQRTLSTPVRKKSK